jgi:hypothetical protein
MLKLLTPDIVEAILGGQRSENISFARLLDPFPLNCSAQPLALCRG